MIVTLFMYFRCQVLGSRAIFTCKHVLAAWLATVDKEKLLYQQVTPQRFQELLLYQASCKNDEP